MGFGLAVNSRAVADLGRPPGLALQAPQQSPRRGPVLAGALSAVGRDALTRSGRAAPCPPLTRKGLLRLGSGALCHPHSGSRHLGDVVRGSTLPGLALTGLSFPRTLLRGAPRMHAGADDRRHQELLPEVSALDAGLMSLPHALNPLEL